MSRPSYEKITDGFWADPAYKESLQKIGLTNLDAVFAFEEGQTLHKSNLAPHRSRSRFELPDGPAVYLKRYTQVPKIVQLKNWLQYGKRVATCDLDRLPGEELIKVGIQTPRVIAYGVQWNALFEKRSFILTEEIPGGVSLEKQLPECLTDPDPLKKVRQRRAFLYRMADWIAALHRSGFCHRDLYLSHIFLSDQKELVLIDLHRTFRPRLRVLQYQRKDLAQLYYSAPGQIISRADRLRFYLRYKGRNKLTFADRLFIGKIKKKARRMANHDIKHGRPVPFTR